MFACFWTPYRHLPATVHPAMRFAADVFSGKRYDFTLSLRSLVFDRFELAQAEGEALTQALAALHLDRSRTQLEQRLLAARASQPIRQTVGAVRSHHDEVEQWLVTAEILAGQRSSDRTARRVGWEMRDGGPGIIGQPVPVVPKKILATWARMKCLYRQLAA